MPTYYVKYKKDEDGVKTLIWLIHEEGVVRVIGTEEEKCEYQEECNNKTLLQSWRKPGNNHKKENAKMASLYLLGQLFSCYLAYPALKSSMTIRHCTFKDRRKSYMKGKIYIKQQLFQINRTPKEVQYSVGHNI